MHITYYSNILTSFPFFFVLPLPSSSSILPQEGAVLLMPVILARDRGDPPNSVECSVIVRLYDADNIVFLIFENTVDSLNPQVLEEIFEDILDKNDVADFYVALVVPINET